MQLKIHTFKTPCIRIRLSSYYKLRCVRKKCARDTHFRIGAHVVQITNNLFIGYQQVTGKI